MIFDDTTTAIDEELSCFGFGGNSLFGKTKEPEQALKRRDAEGIYGELLSIDVKDGKPVVVIKQDLPKNLSKPLHQTSIKDLFEKLQSNGAKAGDKIGYRVADKKPIQINGKTCHKTVIDLLEYVEPTDNEFAEHFDRLAAAGTAAPSNTPPAMPGGASSSAVSTSHLYVALGTTDEMKANVIWNIASEEVIQLSTNELNETRFSQIFGAESILAIFPKTAKGSEELVPDYKAFRDRLCADCRAAGKYRKRIIRHCGVYQNPDNPDELIINSASVKTSSGVEIERVALDRNVIYVADGDLGDPLAYAPASKHDVREIVKALRTWGFERKGDHLYVLGWVAIASYVGALAWRPHIFVTAEPGTGKSMMQRCIYATKPIDFNSETNHMDGASTEAGIRQSIKSKALSLLIDEYEKKDGERGDNNNSEKMDQLLTSASSGTSIIKGAQDGNAQVFAVQFSAFICGVNPPKRSPALTTRSIVIKLTKKPLLSNTQAVEDFISNAADNYRMPLFSRMIKAWPAFTKNLNTIKKVLSQQGFDVRFCDTHGTLIAGAATAWFGEIPLTEKAAKRFVSQFDFEDEKEEKEADNRMLCLNHLLEQRIEIDAGGERQKLSVAELMRDAVLNRRGKALTDYDRALRQFGLSVERREDLTISLFVANDHAQVMSLYRGRRWEKTYNQTLQRIEGAVAGQVCFNGQTRRGWFVPTPITVDGEAPAASVSSSRNKQEQAALDLWNAEKSLYENPAADQKEIFEEAFGGALRRHWQGVAIRFLDQGIEISRVEELVASHFSEKAFAVPGDEINKTIRLGKICETAIEKRRR